MDEIEVEVFKAGDYGEKGRYGEDELKQIAESYDESVHEAPVTIDHAQAGPAFGWVKGLKAIGNRLVAVLGDLNAEFKETVKAGAYKKISVEIYKKFKETGKPYLRAVSFLGAQVPEIKGLSPVRFTEGEKFIDIEYHKGGEGRMDEKELEKLKKDLADAKEKLASFAESDLAKTVASLEARVKDAEAKAAEERQKRLTAEDKAKMVALQFGERTQADVIRAAEQHVDQFCEQALKAGYITPAQIACGLRELMIDASLAPSDKVITFGEGGKVSGSPIEILKSILTQHKVVLFGEAAPGGERKSLGNIAEFAEKARKCNVTIAQYQKACEAVKGTGHTPELYIQANPDEFKN